MNLLQVYLAAHCAGYARTKSLIDNLRKRRPDLRIQVINLDEKGIQVPEYVIGTPIYVLNDRIISLGNPSEDKLLELAKDNRTN